VPRVQRAEREEIAAREWRNVGNHS